MKGSKDCDYQILGMAETSSGINHSFFYDDNIMIDLASLDGGTTSSAERFLISFKHFPENPLTQ
jgi:probable HAF family extracellular repeat protein